MLTPAVRDLLKSRGLHGLGGKRGSEFPGVYSNLPAIEATWRLIEGEPEWIIPAMNRRLVEDATHPEVLGNLLDELAATNDEWNKVGTTLFGRNLSHGKTAKLHSFSTDKDRFDDESFAFPDAEQKILTRLGADNRAMLFPTVPAGPFGIPITEMSLPGYWRGACAALPDDGRVELITQGDGGFQITLGAQTLVYDRWGLRPQ